MYCIIVSTAFPLRGGIAHYVGLLGQALGKRHRVETITFKRQYPSFLFPGKTQEETGAPAGVLPAPQLLDSINPWNWYTVAREIRRRNPDLLIFKYWLPFFGPCFGTVARLAKRGRATRVLFICDNVLPHERRPFDTLFTHYAFRAVDFFVVQSEAVEQELRIFWPRADSRNVPHPIYDLFGESMERQRARETLGLTSRHVLLFFGYIRKYKGLHVLLDALATVRRELDILLVVAGEFYDDEMAYRDHVRRVGLDRNVVFHSDYLPNDQVRIYFSAADAVVLPYLSATQSGIAQIAYNFDIPVIATRVGGLAEVVQDNRTGFVVPPNDTDALAQAILRFYREDKQKAFSDAVRREKGKYSWDALVSTVESFMDPSSRRTREQ
jgi:glycosyltransferase involved in cell wall biosynthesis